MGTYTVFLDVALGISGPALGAIAARLDLGSVFLASALVVASAAAAAGVLIARPATRR